MNPKKNLVLIGMMGSGKSTIGARVAQLLHLPFYDVDKEIEKKAHNTISEIFQQEGEVAFRELEYEIIQQLAAQSPGVIATGGGAFIEKRNQEILKKNGIIFYLNASAETLFHRVKQTTHRPLLQTEDPLHRLKDLLEKRRTSYERADYQIDVEKQSLAEIIQQIITLYSSAS